MTTLTYDTLLETLPAAVAAATDRQAAMFRAITTLKEALPHYSWVGIYVLEGSVVMQAKGKEPVTLTKGQTWSEGPDDVHVVSRNASTSAPARYLVFMVKDKGAPILTPVK